jgi:putative sterol carrier protein
MNPSKLPAPRLDARPEDPSGRLAALATRAVRNASPVALAQLLRSPARKVLLDVVFWHAARQLSRSRSAHLDSTVRAYVTPDAGGEPDVYELRFKEGSCRMARGAGEAKPGLTLALDDSELVRLITGQSTAAQGVFNGRIMVRGDVGRMAATLAAAFASRPPSRRPA